MVQAKIDLRKAITVSEASAADFLGWTTPVVEEIERDTYKNRDCWSITLSQNGSRDVLGVSVPVPKYKRFMVDSETGEVLGMLIRDLAYS